jgi:hypothetical protein
MARTLRREVILLVAVVLVVDGIFVAAYFLAGIWDASNTGKLVFTAVWTLTTLVIAVRGLSRIRSARPRQADRQD